MQTGQLRSAPGLLSIRTLVPTIKPRPSTRRFRCPVRDSTAPRPNFDRRFRQDLPFGISPPARLLIAALYLKKRSNGTEPGPVLGSVCVEPTRLLLRKISVDVGIPICILASFERNHS